MTLLDPIAGSVLCPLLNPLPEYILVVVVVEEVVALLEDSIREETFSRFFIVAAVVCCVGFVPNVDINSLFF